MISIKNDLEKDIQKKVKQFLRPLIGIVFSFAFMILIPILVQVVRLITLPFGETVSYIVCEIITSLSVPNLAFMIIMIIVLMVRFISINIKLGGRIGKPALSHTKYVLLLLIVIVSVFYFSFTSILHIVDLVMDVPHVAAADYLVAEGPLKVFEENHGDSTDYHMNVNGIMFAGRYSYSEKLDEGCKYHIEYLPHSKYVVKFWKMK